TARQMFTKITLPNLKPILVYTLVTSLVGGMQMFDIPYMISGGTGAPSNSILTIQMLMYNKFSSHKGNIAIAGAIGVFLFVVTSIVALVIMRLLRDRDPEGIGRANVRERRKYRKGAARV
ncbi:MAG: ABC transporter permease subunit, partial [Bacillota bacterium]|nr:ABC transporter permease subunit [Bacillota bacterium]